MITIYILFGLTFIIFIHELGHFLAARWCGVKVYTFSLGFGPRIITFYKDKSGTEYILSLIPLGGYVKMKGQEDIPTSKSKGSDSNSQSLNNDKEVSQEIYENDHFLAKSPLQRLFIILAGVSMNLISAFFFVLIAYMIGIPFSSNIVGGFIPGMPAISSGLKIGDEIVEVNGAKTETLEDIITAIALQNQGKESKVKVIRGEASAKSELEFLIKTVKKDASDIPSEINNKTSFFPQLGIIPKNTLMVGKISKDSELYKKGLRKGDVIQRIALVNNKGAQQTSYGIIDLITKNPNQNINLTYLDASGISQTINNVRVGAKEINQLGFYFSAKVNILKGYPAEKAGIKNGDTILSINNQEVESWDDIYPLIQLSEENQENQELAIEVEREGEVFTLTLTPSYDSARERYVLGIMHHLGENKTREVSKISEKMEALVPGIRVGDQVIDIKKEKKEKKENQVKVNLYRNKNLISLSYDQTLLETKQEGYLFDYSMYGKIISYNFSDSFFNSFGVIKKEFGEVLSFFSLLVKGNLPLEVMGGPIAIFEVSYQVANSKGWSYFLFLLAKISISLVIINLLPIPVIDGGHACLIVYEMVRKKPVPEKFLRVFQLIGVVFLLVLIVYVNFNDINRIINR